jgi:hypothetical protein
MPYERRPKRLKKSAKLGQELSRRRVLCKKNEMSRFDWIVFLRNIKPAPTARPRPTTYFQFLRSKNGGFFHLFLKKKTR